MSKISIVINLDTRHGFLEETTTAEIMLKGARSLDFLVEGVINKEIFFRDFNFEILLYIDYHEQLPEETMSKLIGMLNNKRIASITFNNHREYFNRYEYYPKFNDLNYLMAISQARGEYVVHFDADVAAFLNDKSVIDNWLKLLDDKTYDYISYPSLFSPNAVNDPAFDYMWASTRFFICKRDTFRYDEILKCLCDSNYLYGTYGDRERKCPWFEHIISLIRGGNRVWYPPIEYDRCMIFSWNYYKKGTIARLQNMPYDETKKFILSKGGINYPNDVSA